MSRRIRSGALRGVFRAIARRRRRVNVKTLVQAQYKS